MEKIVGVEEARAKLGSLLEEVAGGGEPIVLAKRGQAIGVLLSREEYSRLKMAATRRVRSELQGSLNETRRRIKEAGLDSTSVDEAIAAVREL
jgi:antitoxin YefM